MFFDRCSEAKNCVGKCLQKVIREVECKPESSRANALQSLNGLANVRSAAGPTPLVVKQREIDDAFSYRELVRRLEEFSEGDLVRFNYETIETPKSAVIEKAALTPEHAVQAARNGLKIVHPHKKVAIDIDNIRTASPEVESYFDESLLKDLVASIEQNGLCVSPVYREPASALRCLSNAGRPHEI